ncbi:DUF6549 family protein [Flavobacterium sp. ST-75]|uniref:DUF6549 family protein n=1 Tax=Flavobacterium rhizophilum TaxID=3163296 RepID=A0ABW8Y9Q4_9FLAO
MVKNITPYVISLLLLILLTVQCNKNNRHKNTYLSNLDALTDTVKYYKNKTGTQTATIKTLQLKNNELNDYIINKDEELKAVTGEFSSLQSVVKYTTLTKFDTIYIPLEKPIITEKRFEVSGEKKSKWFSLNYTITNDSLTIAPLLTYTDASVVTGIKRKWFLGKETLTTDVTFTNPNITVTNLKSVTVMVNNPWYKKWYVWLAAGVTGGLLLK